MTLPSTATRIYTLTVVAAIVATAHCNPYGNPKIQWGLCEDPLLEGLQCGTLCVLLDYNDLQSSQTLQLENTKAAATSQPAKGSIHFNFGGPGNTGAGGLSKSAAKLLPLTGGEYDLIAVNTR
ncbi:hypothetical protein BBP40_004067 [Aspergillus hancockii]|nr:hypothetical protein BBP40_004067 [Aspergillus hancockii]